MPSLENGLLEQSWREEIGREYKKNTNKEKMKKENTN